MHAPSPSKTQRLKRTASGGVALKAAAPDFGAASAAPVRLDQILSGGVQLSPDHAAEAGFEGGGGQVPHRQEMEASFGGADFSGVQAHVGTSQARQACDALGANAYAKGGQVAFKSDNPSKALVAHELTHVAQQGHGGVQAHGARGGGLDTSGEAQAEAVEAAVSSGKSASQALAGGIAADDALALSADAPSASGWGAGIVLTPDALVGQVGYNWRINSPPFYPFPVFPALYMQVGAAAQLALVGSIPAGGGNYSIGGRAMGSLSGSIRLGVPRVVSAGCTLVGQIPVDLRAQKNGDNTFVGLTIQPRIRLQLDAVVGPGWWSHAIVLGELRLFTLRYGWNNGVLGAHPDGPDFQWSPEMETALETIKDFAEEAQRTVSAGIDAVTSTASAVWETLTSW